MLVNSNGDLAPTARAGGECTSKTSQEMNERTVTPCASRPQGKQAMQQAQGFLKTFYSRELPPSSVGINYYCLGDPLGARQTREERHHKAHTQVVQSRSGGSLRRADVPALAQPQCMHSWFRRPYISANWQAAWQGSQEHGPVGQFWDLDAGVVCMPSVSFCCLTSQTQAGCLTCGVSEWVRCQAEGARGGQPVPNRHAHADDIMQQGQGGGAQL